MLATEVRDLRYLDLSPGVEEGVDLSEAMKAIEEGERARRIFGVLPVDATDALVRVDGRAEWDVSAWVRLLEHYAGRKGVLLLPVWHRQYKRLCELDKQLLRDGVRPLVSQVKLQGRVRTGHGTVNSVIARGTGGMTVHVLALSYLRSLRCRSDALLDMFTRFGKADIVEGTRLEHLMSGAIPLVCGFDEAEVVVLGSGPGQPATFGFAKIPNVVNIRK